MVAPRVFVSSTCYDLAEERDGISEFCARYGYDTTLSERGDVFYHPDLHTHSSCIRETSNCHIFVLVIGGRFGGKYVVDPTKSITNAEYSAAIANGTPVFTFVKQDVLNDHNVWQRNKHQQFVNEIQYPSIDKPEHAEEIFRFIDAVRLAPVNNGIFPFRLARDIQEVLTKQWASMMFEYLQNRTIARQIALTNDALGNLSVVSGKIEELVKNIYRHVDGVNANSAIEVIDNESLAEEFLTSISHKLNDKKFLGETLWEIYDKHGLPPSWPEFLTTYGFCEIKTETLPDGSEVKALYGLSEKKVFQLSGTIPKADLIAADSLQKGYEKLIELEPDTRLRLASKFFWTKKEADHARRRRDEAEAAKAPSAGEPE